MKYSSQNFIKKEAKQLKKDGWKIAKNLYYGKEEDRKEYFYQTIEEGLNDIYHKEMINNSYRLDSVGNFFLIGMGDAFSPIKVNGENYYINTEKVSLQYAYDDLGAQVMQEIKTLMAPGVTQLLNINNGDSTYIISSIIDSLSLYSAVESDSTKNFEYSDLETIMVLSNKTDDGRFVQMEVVYKPDNFNLQENYSNILLYTDGTIALLESKTEESYYKYISDKGNFINEQNKDVRILMIKRESDDGRKEVRTTIVKEINN